MHIVVRGKGVRAEYLGYTGTGELTWKSDRLDAIRFEDERQARECCNGRPIGNSRVVRVDQWDGHYEEYRGYEIQVFADGLQGQIRGGKRWKYRFGPIDNLRAYRYIPTRNPGYTTPAAALTAVKKIIEYGR